jgi:hypothetical protein
MGAKMRLWLSGPRLFNGLAGRGISFSHREGVAWVKSAAKFTQEAGWRGPRVSESKLPRKASSRFDGFILWALGTVCLAMAGFASLVILLMIIGLIGSLRP